jgi:alpha-L-fucosidase
MIFILYRPMGLKPFRYLSVKPVFRAVLWLLSAFACTLFGQTNNMPAMPIASGPYQPNWDSLASQYQCPEWFRDAKFGIWAVFGPQCQAEDGDWYARGMYLQGTSQNQFHVKHYGPPSQFGFKDVIHTWKAENFDPDQLLAFYKQNGAKYFLAMANHHDNFDLYNSKYQPWNSVAIGPRKDIIRLWAEAAHKNGLRFGVSVHASHTWTWYEPAQGADLTGPLAGVPYDGNLTKADGRGQWWEGLDPQDLYAQHHKPGNQKGWDWWNWDPGKGSTIPDSAYLQNFFLRTRQLWDDYQPDLVYFDDTVVPFHGITDDIGLHLAAHFYNTSIQRHGDNEAVMTGKFLDDQQRRAMVYDIERGKATGILPQPWQTDTCLGDWHYDRQLFERHRYKSAATVIPMLADIVSKNGNLMLSVPVRGDGTIDSDEAKIVGEIGAWLKVYGAAIYATRPWKIYGEGPSTENHQKGQFDGERDTHSSPFTPADIRFTQSKDGTMLYAIILACPADCQVRINSLSKNSAFWPGKISGVRLLGHSGELKFMRKDEGLIVALPQSIIQEPAIALEIDH